MADQPPSPREGGRPVRGKRTWLAVAGALLLIVTVGLVIVLRPHSPESTEVAGDRVSRPPGNGPARNAPTVPGCASKPAACGFPDAASTGVPAGTKLTDVDGDIEIRTPGTVIDGESINGCITIYAPNVTIRRSKISCGGFYGIFSYGKNYSGGGLTITDVEVDCEDTNATGIASYGFVATRVKVHGCENGFAIDNDATVQDSYLYDFYVGEAGHTDGIQLAGGANVTMTHNTIFNLSDGGTSAIISPDSGMSNVVVSDNLMTGGAYTLYCPRDSSSNFRVTGNRISTLFGAKGGAYGPWVYCQQVATVSGNVWDANLQPLPN
jgi:hypothetical protein